MTFTHHLLLSTLLPMAMLAAGTVGAAPTAADPKQWAAPERQPPLAGERIYRGEVQALDQMPVGRLFFYERRVAVATGGLAASHITSQPDGAVVIEERAQVDPNYGLRHFEAVNTQAGHRGTVQVSADGRRLDYRLVDQGVVRTATEEVTAPVVSGPSLHGFILQHWPALVRGQVVPVRFIVLAELRTYGFDIALASQTDGLTRFTVTPSSWWVRLAVAPLIVSFDDRLRHPVRYEGRVPPMVLRNGRLQPLDARVDYAMEGPAYR